jgi:asparagine synthase (glutamine-hydrolysing)
MCGIAGIFHYADPEHPVDRDLLIRMTRRLAHRGPDGEGFHVEGNLGLGHRRLSILDLTPTGAQPMPNDDGTCWITYNGEFYNHLDFRSRLASKGCRFRGSSDTETLLRLMEEVGPDALTETAGIFAFAFWDSRQKVLTLARDHLGVKQLYFHDDGRRIVFASEIKALLEDPEVPRDPDPEAINQYLHFHTALFERTFFRDIRQLRAGEFLRISRPGAVLRSYWSPLDSIRQQRPESELIDDLRHQLTEIVSQQLMADVPVGAFFSGGIDSSAIAAHASKTGKPPICFGVHFSGQGVTDERPFQEAAAKALGLDLRLITMDGSSFPEDLQRLMYQQDEPVIGAAMFPMSRVSELASREVKVCLGGQAADEIFGGYARYALGRPSRVMRSWFQGRRVVTAGEATPETEVGGNLSKQMAEGSTIYRLARNVRHLTDWKTRYFEHFAQVPETAWTQLFAAPDICSRERCRQIFRETVDRGHVSDPTDRIMLWDVQTYLTGLFHQDDRMSMAASLESRVPFADPRMIRFAFSLNPDLKMRGAASKWILRQAVSDVLPPLVLNRRKVGFDTPAERWIRGDHAGFVRDTLLSARARQRGLFDAHGIESLLANPHSPQWFNQVWKALSIEMWASVFLDSAPAPRRESRIEALAEAVEPPVSPGTVLRECRELGIRRTVARGVWELKTRSGLVRVRAAAQPRLPEPSGAPEALARLPFADLLAVGPVLRSLIPEEEARRLASLASEATRGRIQCFGRWMADFGSPVDWHRDPTNGNRWPADLHWSKIFRLGNEIGEIKFVWEAARFPQAYLMARAATVAPDSAPLLAAVLRSQIENFMQRNPLGLGVHWASGQEIALRLLAWLFGMHVFSSQPTWPESFQNAIIHHLGASGAHIASHIEYARDAVYNNHLLSEALGLYAAGCLLRGSPADRWRRDGFDILVEQADRQIYADGAYIQQSHNYHRVAMELYVWAAAFRRRNGEPVPRQWLAAMERSLDFLLAHQNPDDGRLPNYGSNDGSNPVLLASADFSDFRPILQTLSVATRGERIYETGVWDEMPMWFFGPDVLKLPLRNPDRISVSFAPTGYHVLRSSETDSFCAFRCGSIRDRFSQIDMLHADVWWRGENVLVDAGSYLYNGPRRWHNHFLRTASHNTIRIDGQDQMLHVRQFKTLYPTEARLLRFEDHPEWAICEGEHYGYRRIGECVHRRSILFAKEEALWVVLDSITGAGAHEACLHWLAGPYDYEFDEPAARLRLKTPKGPFSLTVLDAEGAPVSTASVTSGAGGKAPRGWLSRYYGEKVPVPSLFASQSKPMPLTFVTLLAGGIPRASLSGDVWSVTSGENVLRFRIEDGSFANVTVVCEPVPELLQ